MSERDLETLRAERRTAGLRIDPENVEVTFFWTEVDDPYGDYPAAPAEYSCVGRSYFARIPGDDRWICFHDLPCVVSDRIWDRIGRHEIGDANPSTLPGSSLQGVAAPGWPADDLTP